MAPAFDRRSIEGYAPVITAVVRDLLAEWDALPDRNDVDVGAAMMRTTLHIISRAMFSANSDEIVEVVERGAGRYQMTMRPSLFDLLGFRHGSQIFFPAGGTAPLRSTNSIEPSMN